MQPVDFDESNHVFTAPKGQEATVNNLPTYYNGELCISCWELSKEDLKLIKDTKKIWLVIAGPNQPVVSLDVEKPFVEQEEDNGQSQEEEG